MIPALARLERCNWLESGWEADDLEAKCYAITNGVGVKEVSQLISRLRARQFGILVTASYLADQAYQEIREDGHPIVVIAGNDVVEIHPATPARGHPPGTGSG